MGGEYDTVALGPLLRKVKEGSRWAEQDSLPGDHIWADFIEIVLEHPHDEGVFEELLPRLQGSVNLKDGVLAEAYVSYYLSNLGFRVLRYEPEVVPGTSMDLEVEYVEREPIFVEVKRPSWKGEVPEEEKSERNKNNPEVTPTCALPDGVKTVLDNAGVQEDDECEEGGTSRIRAWWLGCTNHEHS